MSAGYYIGNFFNSVGETFGKVGEGVAAVGGAALAVVGATAGVALAVAGGAVVTAASVAATAGVAVFESFKGIAGVGIEAANAVKIMHQERLLEKDAWERYKKIATNDPNEETIISVIEKIKEQFKRCGSVVDFEAANNYINKGKDNKEKFEIAQRLLSIQAKFSMMSNNFYSLSDASEKINFNIDDILLKYHNLRNNQYSLDELETLITEINNDINETLKKQKEVIEEAIRNKTFESKFLQINNTQPNLFTSVFANELIDMLKKPEDDEDLQKLAQRREIISLQSEIFEMMEVARGLQGFEERSAKLLQLFGSSIQLAERSDISFNDYLALIELKRKTMREIIRELSQQEAIIYKNKQIYVSATHENIRLRQLLNMDIPSYNFNSTTAIKDIDRLTAENNRLAKEYKENNFAKYVSGELRAQYIKQNYQYIPCDKEEKNEYTTIHKSYFLTPDGENVLCINVNNKGDISEQVVGLKVFGLTKDAKAIYEAQANFCDHSKKVFANLIKELKVDTNKINYDLHKPSDKTSVEVNFEGVLPQYVINRVANARVARKNAELKHRHVGGN